MMSRKPTVAPHPQPVPAGADAFDRALSAWSDAAAFDPTIDPVGQARSTLRRTWVEPLAYSSRNLFDAMARSEPRLYVDFPIDARTRTAEAVANDACAIRGGDLVLHHDDEVRAAPRELERDE